MRILRSADHAVVSWANGLGTTSVVVRDPDSDAWAWRLSLADVVADGPFSVLPGVDRWIAVAAGVGMVLAVGGAEPVELRCGDGAVAFRGDDRTVCRLLDGPIVDVNLMLRRGARAGRLDVVVVEVGERVVLDGVAALVVLDGRLAVQPDERRTEAVAGRFDAVVASDERGAIAGSARAIVRSRVAVVRLGDP